MHRLRAASVLKTGKTTSNFKCLCSFSFEATRYLLEYVLASSSLA